MKTQGTVWQAGRQGPRMGRAGSQQAHGHGGTRVTLARPQHANAQGGSCEHFIYAKRQITPTRSRSHQSSSDNRRPAHTQHRVPVSARAEAPQQPAAGRRGRAWARTCTCVDGKVDVRSVSCVSSNTSREGMLSTKAAWCGVAAHAVMR